MLPGPQKVLGMCAGDDCSGPIHDLIVAGLTSLAVTQKAAEGRPQEIDGLDEQAGNLALGVSHRHTEDDDRLAEEGGRHVVGHLGPAAAQRVADESLIVQVQSDQARVVRYCQEHLTLSVQQQHLVGGQLGHEVDILQSAALGSQVAVAQVHLFSLLRHRQHVQPVIQAAVHLFSDAAGGGQALVLDLFACLL